MRCCVEQFFQTTPFLTLEKNQMTEQTLQNQKQQTVVLATNNEEHPAPLCQTREIARINTAGLDLKKVAAPTGKHQFDAPTSLIRLRERNNKKRRQRYQQSRLSHWRAEIVELRKAGASYREIQAWLAAERRIKVEHTDVLRFLKKLPEMQSTENNIVSKLVEENENHA
ncbi:MAG: hypothetical protein K0S08_728 [Gammaproteobacteria bacterium]|jgi:hypothetical protein|nr:hypothetical protein [Gammaproteobacteria bacterium]